MLADVKVAPLPPLKHSTAHKSASSPPGKRGVMQLRFRADSTTVVLPTSEEFGVLDIKTSDALTALRTAIPSIRLELVLDQDQVKMGASILSLQINVYGHEVLMDNVGSTLSKASMFLQEPAHLDPKSIYRNPHVLSWEDEVATPRFRRSYHPSSFDFTKEIDVLFGCSDVVTPPYGLSQDRRVRTILHRSELF
ncbi:hypothetical protein MMC12_006966 [Toensbergia leucococca]|nr:hypothetical protein [Toensbergia leucococca]